MKKFFKRLFCGMQNNHNFEAIFAKTFEHTWFAVYRCKRCGRYLFRAIGETLDKDIYKEFN